MEYWNCAANRLTFILTVVIALSSVSYLSLLLYPYRRNSGAKLNGSGIKHLLLATTPATRYRCDVTLNRACLLQLLASLALFAQRPAPVISPEVLPGRHVTFRIKAPMATAVTLSGDWLGATPPPKLVKDNNGIWSITVGPLEPSIYIYSFTVDGVAMADPLNPRMKLRASTSASLVEVDSEPPAFWQPRDVPHGAVEINWEKSQTIHGETRAIWIYTPPGYAKNIRRYPVLYLLHGSNDTAAGWTTAGYANFVLDNLLAENKIVPMVMVMPFGHATPFGVPVPPGGVTNDALFEDYMLKDVIPTVEARYRVAPGRQNRAIAGLSMGGGQALKIGMGHLDLFSAVASFSGAIPADFETRFAGLLKNPQAANARLKPLWFACGRQDSLFSRSKDLSDLLDKYRIQHTFYATDGVHNYTVWRKYLAEYAPLLFRKM